jgi:quinoprotein glucose dehydrogenase
VTPGYRMIALDARTGTPIATFGTNGVVDLKLENDQELDLVTADIGLNATPLVAGDVGRRRRRAPLQRLAQDR